MTNAGSSVARSPQRPYQNRELASVVLGREIREFARLAASNEYPVLLEGESGVGKTHLARLIHARGAHSIRPWVHVNCGAIPTELFEAEMFGHVRGAFTDAKESREGFFETASGGTLFLDEVADLPMRVQPKLLTAIEDHYIRRVGSVHQTRVQVRLIAATNANLAERVANGSFREDLYYRCAVLNCRLPALRDRPDDLPAIVDAMYSQVVGEDAPASRLDDCTMRLLCEYPWPGNLREVDNVLRQATVLADGGIIRPDHLPLHVREPAEWRGGCRPVAAPRLRYASVLPPSAEREQIQEALRLVGGNRTRAAKRLGMSRSTLWMKLQVLGIGLTEASAPRAGRPATGDADEVAGDRCRAPLSEIELPAGAPGTDR